MPLAAPRALFALVLSVVLLCPSHASATGQSLASGESSIRVKVTDPSGAVLVGARVLVTDEAGATAEALTNAEGEALFSRIRSGRYDLRGEYEGFDPLTVSDVRVRGRETRRELRLPLARISDEVTVGRDPREARTDPRSDAFATVLSREQIDALPDDPDDLEQVLNNMAGPGAVMRVNGFRGGRLPPKSQIQEIRFRRNFFAADSHEAGFVSIDIRTRPGSDSFRGSLDLGFRDDALNARNAFAPHKGDEQQHRFGLSMEGPLWKNRTSYAFNTDGFDNFDSKTIVAALPGGTFQDVVRRPSDRMNFNARIEHALTKTHALRAELQRGSTENRNLGVGDYDLRQRAYSRTVDSTVFRLSESGPLGRRLFNELRFQLSSQEPRSVPGVSGPAVLVLTAFNGGGAQVQGARRAHELELADNLDISLGRHTMRTGLLVEGGKYRSTEARNQNGVFVFPSLDAYTSGAPTTYSQMIGNPLVDYSQYQLGWYVQDDIRVRKDLTVSLGLRHEVQSHLADWNNFSPRAGFTWSPFKNGSTTFRGGIGVFYDWYTADTYEQTLRVNGSSQSELVVQYPGYPDPYDGGLVAPLPPGRIQADPALRMPGITQASFGAERRLAANTIANVTYFETRGWDQLRGRNINAPLAGMTRPDPAVGNITQVESSGRSAARSVVFGLNANVPQRRMFLAMHYVYGISRNEADGPLSLPADNYDLDVEWGPTPQDVRHRVMGMFSTPIWKQLRFSSQFRAGSAAPYNITTGFDDNGDTVSNDRPVGVGRNSARGKGQWDIGGRLQYSFGFGTRPPQTGPGVPVVRVVRAGDDGGPIGGMMMGAGATDKRVRLDVYIAASNIFNTVNYTNFSGVLTSPFYGLPTAAQPGRRVELGARVGF
ncbi:MAG: carboxypeptidase regulatory-like domain-containing protein [Acidobacteriota bacterium]